MTRLRASEFVLKESAPKKWRQYLPGVWRRHQGKPQYEIILKRGRLTLEEFTKQLKQEHLQAAAVGGKPVFSQDWD